MSRVVGYVRISDADQSHNSIAHQSDSIVDYCKRNNLELSKLFVDKGKSAFTFNRPAWLELEAYIKANKDVKYLVVYHLDRFSRANLMDALIKINELENKLSVKVLTVTDPVNLNTNDLGVQILRTIGLLFSNNERQRIKERTTDGMIKSLNMGRYCSMAPYGYTNTKDHEGKPLLKIVEHEADIVRKIFNWFNNGKSIEQIGVDARKLGFKRYGNSSIQRILSNPVYAGLIHVPAYKGNAAKTVKGIHAPIISELAYYDAMEKMNKKKVNRRPSEEVFLRGVIRCHCGRFLTAGPSRGKSGKLYWYYFCESHRKKNYSANKLHQNFYQILQHLSFDDGSIEYIKTKIVSAIENELNNKGGNLMRVKMQLQKVQDQINTTQEKYLLQPDISPEAYSKVMVKLKAEELRLQSDVAKYSEKGSHLYKRMNELLDGLNDVANIFNHLPQHGKHNFIRTVFDNSLMVEDGKTRTLYIHPIFADKVLILKEKGLLEIKKGAAFFNATPISAPGGNILEHLIELSALLVA